MKSQSADVLVLGGGIIGVTLALELQKSGRRVFLIDKSEPGYGCSYGNAGWLTPCFSMPLPQPGMFLKSIGWLLNPESPLYIKPTPSWVLVRWMLNFLMSMNEKKMRESIEVLTEISKYGLNFYASFSENHSDLRELGFNRKGLLMVSAEADGLRSALTEMSLMHEQGVEGKRLSTDEIQQLEPALRPGLKGGVYFPNEAHIEPLAIVKALTQEFINNGGSVFSRTEVFGFETSSGKIEKVLTTKGPFTADLVALALGSWSKNIANDLKLSLPVLGGKGYSLITNSFEQSPTHPIMVVEKKLAITPRENSVRLAGTLELVDGDDSITQRRMHAILKSSQQYLKMHGTPQIQEIWRGLRPCTPDGVPVIGFSKKWSNLFYSVGHQMLGLQSAPGSARLSSDIIEDRTPLADPIPFSPLRYE